MNLKTESATLSVTMPTLTLPHPRYQVSFLTALAEYQAENLPAYRQLDAAWLAEHFADYVDQLAAESRGEQLPPGFMPHTVYWLVEGDEYLGRVDIRHQLNTQLDQVGGHIGYDVRPSQRGKGYGTLALRLGLEKAQAMGINPVLVTCDVSNGPSNKIIQANGGVLENTLPATADHGAKNRYWISQK